MRIFIDQSSLVTSPRLLINSIALLKDDAAFLRGAYPNFDSWLLAKVIPGVLIGDRTIIIEMREKQVAGFMILKHNCEEKKLCTLRVRPQYESLGMGVRLFNSAFEILGTERPLLSVSEKTLPKFDSIFKYFGFSQEAIYENRYLPSMKELSFNGLLDKEFATVNNLSRLPIQRQERVHQAIILARDSNNHRLANLQYA